MHRFALLAALVLSASPALATYEDVEAHLDLVKTATLTVSQPVPASSQDAAPSGTCTLTSAHLVTVPETFAPVGTFETACLQR